MLNFTFILEMSTRSIRSVSLNVQSLIVHFSKCPRSTAIPYKYLSINIYIGRYYLIFFKHENGLFFLIRYLLTN